MASPNTIFRMLFVFALYGPSFAQEEYSPCPILGPRYPQPVRVTASAFVEEALKNLTTAFDELIQSGGDSSFTGTTPNTTTFSVALFDASDLANGSTPFFYEYHHVAPTFVNKTSVDAGSVYNVGGLSQFLTVYTFLAAVGDDLWYDSITKYLPELKQTFEKSIIKRVDWDHVLLIDLATHLAGIPREAITDTISDILPEGFAALLPQSSPKPSTNTTSGSVVDVLRNQRRPVYQPGTTPIYSDTAFQLLALALEKITGQSFASTFAENLLSPLGISHTFVGTPVSVANAVILTDPIKSGWQTQTSETALLAATGMFSTISDISTIGKSILRSTLLSSSTTNRWLKPHSYTSNPRNGVGMPFDIFTPTLAGGNIGPIIETYTKLGANGLYSPYFGIVPDHGVGFVILSADTNRAADLNAYADLVAQYLIPAMENTAGAEATINYAGHYMSPDGASSMIIDVDGLSGLSVLNWTAGGDVDIKRAYAQLAGISAETLDMRLYPTNIRDDTGNGTNLAFRAVLQDIAAPVDAGTPTCITWEEGVDALVYNGVALDEFVFGLDGEGGALAVTIPALAMTMQRE